MLSRITRNIKPQVSKYGRSFSHWKQYEMGPSDPIVGLNESFALDSSPTKVNVGVGAYRGDDGLPYILPCVREAEKINMAKASLNHEYLGIVGDTGFVKLALEFVYGADSPVLKDGRVAGVQTLSGTGGLRVFGELLKKGGHKEIYVVSKCDCSSSCSKCFVFACTTTKWNISFCTYSRILLGETTFQLCRMPALKLRSTDIMMLKTQT